MVTQFDVVVVGAGPAGSSAAREVSRAGARVLLLDFKHQPGVPVQCAEYVPQQIRNLQPLRGTIVQRTDRMLTHINEFMATMQWTMALRDARSATEKLTILN